MSKFSKYLVYFIFTYFIVDFTTGFNSDFSYWLSVGGPIIGIIVYTLSGLFFSYLIYKRKIVGTRLFLAIMLYALFFEVIVFKNPLMMLQNIYLGLPLLVIIYSLIIFLPKWLVDKDIKKNLGVISFLIITWLLIAIIAYFINPHKL